MYIVGHVLFWHNQTPEWIFLNSDGEQASKELLLQRMRDHVKYIANRYGDRIKEWDVVNEAIDGEGNLRKTKFVEIIGENFVAEAFKIANEELPQETKLLYNDYSMSSRQKYISVINMVRDLKSEGFRVDGVGFQGHWEIDRPAAWKERFSLFAFNFFDIPVSITELDLDYLSRWWWYQIEPSEREKIKADSSNNPFPNGTLPPDAYEALASRYIEILSLYSSNSKNIRRLTFWGVSDGDSWLNDWPVEGRTNYPLLFDRAHKPKDFYNNVLSIPTES